MCVLSLSLPRVELLPMLPSWSSWGIFTVSGDLVSAGGFLGGISSSLCVSLGGVSGGGGVNAGGGVSISLLET